MKKLLLRALPLFLVLCLLCPMTALADTGGSGNIDGGGGGMGQGTSTNSWSPGNEGVRVTVVRASDHAVVTTPIDLSNKSPSSSIYHFGKVSKIQYNNGRNLQAVQGGYTTIKPPQAIPKVISTNGSNNMHSRNTFALSFWCNSSQITLAWTTMF